MRKVVWLLPAGKQHKKLTSWNINTVNDSWQITVGNLKVCFATGCVREEKTTFKIQRLNCEHVSSFVGRPFGQGIKASKVRPRITKIELLNFSVVFKRRRKKYWGKIIYSTSWSTVLKLASDFYFLLDLNKGNISFLIFSFFFWWTRTP